MTQAEQTAFSDEVIRILTGLSQLDSGPDEPGAIQELCEAARVVLVKIWPKHD